MKKFHYQEPVKSSYWRISRILVAFIIVLQIVSLQYYYIQNIQVDALEVDQPYMNKLKEARNVEHTSSTSLIFMGDVMMDRSIGRSILAGTSPFVNVVDKLSNYDIRVANIETTIADPQLARKANKPYTFNSPLESLNVLKDANIDISSLANNHTGDYGRAATGNMIDQFNKANLEFVGAGKDTKQAFSPKIIDKNGVKVVFIAMNDIELAYTKVSDNTPGTAYLDQDLIIDSIKQAKQKDADVIVAILHWGVEYSMNQSARQTNWAHFLVDNGVDLVIGGHPHVIQPTETYKGKQIVYSLGNFIFDGMSGSALSGQMIAVEIKSNSTITGKIVKDRTISIGPVESIGYTIDNQGFPVPN